MLWRAQTFRHMVHLLPGQTILELGCGEGIFTRQLVRCRAARIRSPPSRSLPTPTGRRTCPPEVAFLTRVAARAAGGQALRLHRGDGPPGPAQLRHRLLQNVYDLLKPGGQVLFYESNPGTSCSSSAAPCLDSSGGAIPAHLLSRPQLYELISEIGFIRVFAVYNDFVYAPLTRRLVWLLRNLSILLENAPVVRTPGRLDPRSRAEAAARS